MCGIFGIFGSIFSPETNLKAFKALEHRGPDGFHNITDDKSFSCSAVRLAFQDVERGKQPFASYPDGDIIVSLNGEIYNHNELRNELSIKGYKFETLCDTEVLIALYQEYGIDFLKIVKGMYAISIWDKKRSRGYLASDFLSQKPIFYAEGKCNNLIYSSELGCLISLMRSEEAGASTLSINNQALFDILTVKAIVGGQTIYNGINKLRASEYICYEACADQIKLKSYKNTEEWSLNINVKDDSVEKTINHLLRSAVEKRIDASKPQAVYLSGGLDSSLISYIIRDLYPDVLIHSFNLTYQGDFRSEGKDLDSKLAKVASREINSEHHEIQIDPANLGANLEEIIHCFGEPFAAVPSMWFVARQMKKFAKYTISGDGADELFGSYYTHRYASGKKHHMIEQSINICAEYAQSFIGKQLSSRIGISVESIAARIKSGIIALNKNYLEIDSPVRNQLMIESKLLFPYGVLTYVDRLSMAHSLEPRSPFLDKDLWSYVMRLPDKFRINGNTTKRILKTIAKSYLPLDIVDRKKEGFVFPLYPYILKDKDQIISDILNLAIKYPKIFKSWLNIELLNTLFLNISSGQELAFKEAQFIHALNTISIWDRITQ